MDWTPIFLLGIALLMAADLLVFRVGFPPRTLEGKINRIIEVLAWVFIVFLVLLALVLIIA